MVSADRVTETKGSTFAAFAREAYNNSTIYSPTRATGEPGDCYANAKRLMREVKGQGMSTANLAVLHIFTEGSTRLAAANATLRLTEQEPDSAVRTWKQHFLAVEFGQDGRPLAYDIAGAEELMGAPLQEYLIALLSPGLSTSRRGNILRGTQLLFYPASIFPILESPDPQKMKLRFGSETLEEFLTL